ncbi:F0F1 ATP synthase subunit epsilon [Desulfoferula mesophila]|uniref:F0F1 ATP synthase subunit epsilon n=1 Tax=Desulfoferula mesophila TaxID=3058419 RepID=A0AAU9EAJ5_9BACT|nr:F0F1 ATP synthase subunit epsilon [Desulfoferula mesophilus]
MKLKVLLPDQVLVDEEAAKVVAEAENGSFCLLPRHVDFVAALSPGILNFVDQRGREVFLALDEGVLVKQGAEVLVSTRRGVRGDKLGDLRQLVDQRFSELDEQEVKARSAMAKIEAGFVRRFLELQEIN